MRVLFISGSLGMGHVTRDLAMVNALRARRPSLTFEWLAGQPARDVLVGLDEAVRPESDGYGDNTESAEAAADGFTLNLLDYLKASKASWKRNVEVFTNLLAREHFDLIVGDETYELSLAINKDPRPKTAPFVLILDFCGLDYASSNVLDRITTYGWNWAWAGGPKGAPPAQDMTMFVGEPGDVPNRRFGPFLPNRRELARRYYTFIGYVFDFDPATLTDRSAIRRRLGYDGRPLVVCSIGGTSIGADLLRLCADALPLIRANQPDVHMVLVCGPRLDRASIDAPDGVTVLGYVPRLYEHFAASDLAIVQGGGTTTLELTALRRPFISFPLEGHTEQEVTVAEQCRRHGAGIQLRYSDTSAADLAATAERAMAQATTWPSIPTDGAEQAARALERLLR
jgi:UDP:flavonoid glycosyltransferase YjiC (YdhE family)